MTPYSDITRSMARREVSHAVESAAVTLPRARPRIAFKSGIIRPIDRLFVWLGIGLRFYFGNLLDVLHRRDSVERRAARLRQLFEEVGPTFAKLAQQLSNRADILPYAYCLELGKLLDQAPAFPTEQAIEIIERNLGRSLADVFDVFDPKPIGSASLACVYQAQLKTGQPVAVKVRRPGIGPLIAADLRALDWILIVAETITIITPGLYRRFREEFETILFNELNFRAEARYTDMFRRRTTKGRKDITAPRVYFQYCTEEVMVSELVSGVFMWELMAAVDSNDQQFLAKVRRQGIDPKTLASKLMRIMNREAQEELFFHADPHPANLIVLPDNKICFIDFGAIGRYSTKNRKLFREMAYHMAMGDIGRLANASISFLSPLPPRDVERIRKAMDKIYADAIFAMHSANAEWWEKIPAQGWLKFMEVGRQFSLPVSSDALLFIRTRFSYDVIIHRLSKDVDFTKEWQAYERERAQEVRSRVRKKIRQRLREPTDADYLQLEEAADVANQFLFRFQRTIETPIIHFRNVVGKLSYIASLFLKLGYLAGVAIGIGLLADAVARRWFGREIDWASILEHVTTSRWVQLALIAAMLVFIRKIMIRLSLPDTGLGSGRR